MSRETYTLRLLAISSALMLTGCALRVGPKTISPDRFDYSQAIGRSWKEQMVLNMVKLRYVDPPLFMEVAQLVQAGWPIDAVLGIGVRSINGIHAGSRGELLRASGDPEFYKLLETLRALQKSDGIGMRVQAEGTEGNILVLRGAGIDAATLVLGQTARKLLKLSPDATEFSLAFGSTPRNDKEIAVLTRSMLEILQEAAAGVEVPAAHLAEGRVVPMPQDAATLGTKLAIPIHSSETKPAPDEVYAAVHYRKHWFWISDREVAAKRGLSS